ncbi:MAG: RHS repeat protein [Anaerolineae bacterium]|nr:RHS repeat protein [Anaerolineae bacterium]
MRNIYNSVGEVIEQYDADDNQTTFTYDRFNHKTMITPIP